LRGLLIIGSPRQGQNYGGFTTVYDVGGAYASTVVSHGGIVTKIGLDGPPFALEPTRENLQAIWLLVRTLLRKGGRILEPREEENLRGHIRAVYSLPRDVRALRYLMLPPDQQQYLTKWVNDGVYAHVFDNVKDELHLARLQAFDFEGVGDHQDVTEPLLMWLTSRKEVQHSDPQYLHLPKTRFVR
jgi:type IV secretion system protein VirB4